MSMVIFQTELARLITNPQFRAKVREVGATALAEELTLLERRRLLAVAASPGLDVTWSLHKGFRLNKLLSRMPFTCALLDDDVLAREIGLFWDKTPPTSFYFTAEASAFCDHLLERAAELAIPCMEEVVALERATLLLQLPNEAGAGGPPAQVLRFEHDPSRLLAALQTGAAVGDLPIEPCVLIGQRNSAGDIAWRRAAAPEEG